MSELVRKIIHVDMDAFYASVEQRDNPDLQGKPLVVGGSPTGRGVVTSPSYEARKFGVRSAMSARQAIQLCPRAVFVRPRFEAYKQASKTLRKIFREITDLVEPLSLDEAYLDVTENRLGEPSAKRLAIYLRSRIRGQLNLTASAGVAPNKFLAKIGSDWNKPDGLCVIAPKDVEKFLEKLPVEKLWGVGPATAKRLHARGLHTTADIRACRLQRLLNDFGKFGVFLQKLSRGEDNRRVCAYRSAKSRGSERTFEKDIHDLKLLKEKLYRLADEVSLSVTKMDRRAQTVTLKVRYRDFTTITRSRTLEVPFQDTATIFETAWDLMVHHTQAGQRPVRLIGVSLHNFYEHGPVQLKLFS